MLIKSLQINREELFAFAQLISKDNPAENVNLLLGIIGEKARKNTFHGPRRPSQRRKEQA